MTKIGAEINEIENNRKKSMRQKSWFFLKKINKIDKLYLG